MSPTQDVARGKFIVFEGLDGAGTTTQTSLLADWLRQRGVPIEVTREPSEGPIGALLRQALGGGIELGNRALALAFAADRLDHLGAPARGIEASLDAGRWVLSDRYVLSSLAYQTSGEIDLAWLAAINRFAPAPDVTIFVDTPAEVCLQRIAARGGRPERFDAPHELARVLDNYKRIVGTSDQVGHLITVDGRLSQQEVLAEIARQLRAWVETEPGVALAEADAS